ncbi:MAG: cytochrome c oxidase assembly protein [Alphaproteobacteria bacterium]|nr:cytochrome c oxidase assembly protein [Alphaproteobacteria bacterium]
MTYKRRNIYMTLSLCLATIGFMGVLVWAAVPLYEIFCRVTGYGGTTSRAETAPNVVVERVIEIRFDAGLHRSMAWDFTAPAQPINLRPGETALAFYRAHNPTDEVIIGTASFNVTPQKAGSYFSKIDCFCFVEQTLLPGQSADMPVTFFIDPSIATDSEMDDINTITLSYTFFRSKQAANINIENKQPRG